MRVRVSERASERVSALDVVVVGAIIFFPLLVAAAAWEHCSSHVRSLWTRDTHSHTHSHTRSLKQRRRRKREKREARRSPDTHTLTHSHTGTGTGTGINKEE